MIYLDNSATTWPKPPAVIEAMARYLEEIGGNPGRSGHSRSIDAARTLYEAREALAAFFHVRDPLRIVFTLNATDALNLALKGLLHPGDHVITSSMEHNSVMRPLRDLEKRGIELSVVPCSETAPSRSGRCGEKDSSQHKDGDPDTRLECHWNGSADSGRWKDHKGERSPFPGGCGPDGRGLSH